MGWNGIDIGIGFGGRKGALIEKRVGVLVGKGDLR